ncbi:flagellar protein FlgN [Bacillus sp. V5-8f]|uniref:flagellar protein FlgN n=1 Tax=Bacillus sp. V5-8f TaxID=2053044 RepID=UPI000C78EA38|nr:flagellar protein FlgN [Bacillus sp. V5-8f]PLT35710.1 hypothetical protein CUU64_00050 [Bacillus sp. V5-8f]
MSARQIILLLEKLVDLHKNLGELANSKTEIIKKGDIGALQGLLLEEQKLIKAIQSLEKERETVTREMVDKAGAADEAFTITRVIEYSSTSEAEALQELKDELLEEVAKLKDRNHLNQQLLQQSLQFLNISMELLVPREQTYNYERPAQPINVDQNAIKSIFDSKA